MRRPTPRRAARVKAAKPDADMESVIVDFQDTVIALRRVTRRVALSGIPELPSSETELMVLVDEFRGISVSQAARIMQVSPNTVSTLIRSLVGRGLIERRSNPSDKRLALLHLTAAGNERMRNVRSRRAELMANAMLSLDKGDRKAIADVIPAMRNLLGKLKKKDTLDP